MRKQFHYLFQKDLISLIETIRLITVYIKDSDYLILHITGTTISERDAELQAICPGKASTSGTMIVRVSFQAVPHTPFPYLIRVQAIGP